MAVRQDYLATIMDTEFEPFEDYRETEIPQPLPIAPSPVPPSDNPYLIVGQAHTAAARDTESEPEEASLEIEEFEPLATRTTPLSSDYTPSSSDLTPVSPLTDEEFEASKPSDTRITSTHSIAPLDSTTPLSPDHPLTQTSPTSTRVSYYHSTARMARYRSSYEIPSPSSSPKLPIWKRYRGTSDLVEDTKDESLDLDTEGEGSEDEGSGSEEEEEEAAPEGQQQAVSVVDTAAYKPLDLGYGALRRYILICIPPIRVPVQTPPLPEWSYGSLPVSPSSSAVPTLIASPVTTPAATIAVDEDEFLEVGVQLELHGSIHHDHTQRLDALPPALFEGYDRDFRELYTRSREVRDEIFSQRYMLRSLKQEQERVLYEDRCWL
uniref:Uncharacterized protein n=1 Tax=Tanacetum cinerariifolium TaxID=118510 RepID=A0A699HD44_TANCI|nr:hypothetical protein [Tanacetum cinerariifolium]